MWYSLMIDQKSQVNQVLAELETSDDPQKLLLHEMAWAVREHRDDQAVELFERAATLFKIEMFSIYYEACRAYSKLGRDEMCYYSSLLALQYRKRQTREAFIPFLYTFNYLNQQGLPLRALEIFSQQVSDSPELPIAEPWKVREVCAGAGLDENGILTQLVGPIAEIDFQHESTTVVDEFIHQVDQTFSSFGGKVPESLDRYSRILERPAIRVFQRSQASIIIADGFIVTTDQSDVAFPPGCTVVYPAAVSRFVSTLRASDVARIEVDRAVIIADKFPSPNICHFLLDQVTRLNIYEQAGVNWASAAVIGPELSLPYQKDVIDQLGIKHYIGLRGYKKIVAQTVFISSNCISLQHPAHHGSRWALDFVWAKLGRGTTLRRRLYISRSDAVGRQITNEKEILKFLARFDFEEVVLSNLTFEQQRDLFSTASYIVAVHGAGLTNAVFAAPGVAVVEIFHPKYATPGYAALADGARWKYAAVIARDGNSDSEQFNSQEFGQGDTKYMMRNVTVNVEILAAALRHVGLDAHVG